ncbi:MAG: chemotaxis protein CheW [Candidatus Riflebacteria bacterium]
MISDHGTRQFCSFWLEGRFFGFDILDVREINTETNFTPIFHAPPTVRGYVNIRSQIHLILDLRVIMGLPPLVISESNRLFIFKTTISKPFGVLVDRIDDIISVPEEQIEMTREGDLSLADDSGQAARGIISGICKLDKGLLVILNPREILKMLGSFEKGGSFDSLDSFDSIAGSSVNRIEKE